MKTEVNMPTTKLNDTKSGSQPRLTEQTRFMQQFCDKFCGRKSQERKKARRGEKIET